MRNRANNTNQTNDRYRFFGYEIEKPKRFALWTTFSLILAGITTYNLIRTSDNNLTTALALGSSLFATLAGGTHRWITSLVPAMGS